MHVGRACDCHLSCVILIPMVEVALSGISMIFVGASACTLVCADGIDKTPTLSTLRQCTVTTSEFYPHVLVYSADVQRISIKMHTCIFPHSHLALCSVDSDPQAVYSNGFRNRSRRAVTGVLDMRSSRRCELMFSWSTFTFLMKRVLARECIFFR